MLVALQRAKGKAVSAWAKSIRKFVRVFLYPVPQNAPHVSAGMNVLKFPEGQRPKTTETSPWYRVYRTAAWYKCFFWVSCEEIFTTKNAKGAKVKNKVSNHGARTVGHHIERAGVPAGDEGLMDFIGQAIEKSQKCAEKNQVGARCRAGQGVNHEKAQGSIYEHVNHLVRLGELIQRGQIGLGREYKDQSHVKKSRKPINKSSSHVGCVKGRLIAKGKAVSASG